MFKQRADTIRSVWKGSLWLPCCEHTGTGTGGCWQLSEEGVTVTPTQCWRLLPPSLSTKTSGYTIFVAVTFLSNSVPWAYGGALRSF